MTLAFGVPTRSARTPHGGARPAQVGSSADGLYTNLWRIQAGDLEAVPRSFLEDAVRRRSEVDLDVEYPESADVETD